MVIEPRCPRPPQVRLAADDRAVPILKHDVVGEQFQDCPQVVAGPGRQPVGNHLQEFVV